MSPIARRWAVLLLFRVVALVVGVQVSGLAPAVDELACFAVEAIEPDEPCPSDEPCNDCSPGCPTCHCPNSFRSVVPEPYFGSVPALPLAALLALDEASQAPPGPDLPSLFRPPRSTPNV